MSPILNTMREIKSPAEIALITRASRIGGEAILEAMRSTAPGLAEALQKDPDGVLQRAKRIKEAPGNLAAREGHFTKRRGGAADQAGQAKRKRQMLRP